MIVPDVNLLVYAYDASSAFHLGAKRWCEQLMTSPEPVALLPVVIFGFVRVITHTRVFVDPLRAAEAADIVSRWLDRPHVAVVEMTGEDVRWALGLLAAAGTAGNLTSDAQIAAVALRLGGRVDCSTQISKSSRPYLSTSTHSSSDAPATRGLLHQIHREPRRSPIHRRKVQRHAVAISDAVNLGPIESWRTPPNHRQQTQRHHQSTP